jgi:protein SCO1/2
MPRLRFTPVLSAIFGFTVLVAVPTYAGAVGPDGVVPASSASGSGQNESDANATIEERIGAPLPLDLVFRDESEQPITLRDCVVGKPTILVPMYYRCPKLCNIVLENLIDYLREIPNYSAGTDFNVVCVSFDPKEHSSLASEKRKNTLHEYGRPNAELTWRFLTGKQESIKPLMEAIGYKYEYDRTFKEYNHPSGLLILTPEGKISRYFYGIGFFVPADEQNPEDGKNQGDGKRQDREFKIQGGTTTLRLSLVEASEGKMGSLTDRLLLTCYSWDHSNGYAFRIKRAVQIGGIITVLTMLTWVGLALRRERRKAASTQPGATTAENQQQQQNDSRRDESSPPPETSPKTSPSGESA